MHDNSPTFNLAVDFILYWVDHLNHEPPPSPTFVHKAKPNREEKRLSDLADWLILLIQDWIFSVTPKRLSLFELNKLLNITNIPLAPLLAHLHF